MTTRPPTRLVRWLAASTGLLALAFLAACTSQTLNGSFATLHRSTFSRMVNNAEQTAVLFAGGTRALVADNIWDNRRLFLVDLEAGSRSELDLPRQGGLNLSRLLYGDDTAYALYQGEDDRLRVFQISADGALAELAVLDYATVMVGREPPDAAAVEAALAGGELSGLRGMEKERCAWDGAAGSYVTAAVERLRHFANNGYLVLSNDAAISARLEQFSGPLVRDSCVMRLPSEHGRYRLELARTDAGMGGGTSALDGRIETATLLRDGEAVQTFSFTRPDAWYYHTAWVGNRLYFVGASVRSLDLDQLP